MSLLPFLSCLFVLICCGVQSLLELFSTDVPCLEAKALAQAPEVVGVEEAEPTSPWESLRPGRTERVTLRKEGGEERGEERENNTKMDSVWKCVKCV